MRAGYSEAEASFTIMSTLYVIRGMAINSIWQKNMPYYRSLPARMDQDRAIRRARTARASDVR